MRSLAAPREHFVLQVTQRPPESGPQRARGSAGGIGGGSGPSAAMASPREAHRASAVVIILDPKPTVGRRGPTPREASEQTGDSRTNSRPWTAHSHAEWRSLDGFDSLSGAADFDVRRALTAKQVEQQLTGQPGEASSRISSTCSQHPARPYPLELEPDAAQSPCEEPPGEADIAPQRVVQRRSIRPSIKPVGSTDMLMVNEKLIEVRTAAHPPDAKEPARRSRTNRRE